MTTAPHDLRLGPAREVAARHWEAATDALAGPAGRPVAVMAHGFGGTVDSGLEPFARGLAAAGLDVLAFDYRGFGASGGAPRQTVSVDSQLADYRAAVDHARTLPGVDAERVVLWGVSLSGGHVLALAAEPALRDRVAAVVALTPLVDGLAAGALAARHHAPSTLLRSTVRGVRSRVARPVLVPLVGEPGSSAALTLPGVAAAYRGIAGPTWRDEVDAAVALELGSYRPGRTAKEVRAPALVQIADFDRMAPPHAALKTAGRARAEVRHYPGDHFDVYEGGPCFERALAHQVAFLTRVLAPGTDPGAAPDAVRTTSPTTVGRAAGSTVVASPS